MDDPDPGDDFSSNESETSCKPTKKTKKKKSSKTSKNEIQHKMLKHIKRFQSIRRGVYDKVLRKNPMDVVGAICNLHLQTDKEIVA